MNASTIASPVLAAGVLPGRPVQEPRAEAGTGSFDAVFEDAVLDGLVLEGEQGEGVREEPVPVPAGLQMAVPLQVPVASNELVGTSDNGEELLAAHGEQGTQVFVRARGQATGSGQFTEHSGSVPGRAAVPGQPAPESTAPALVPVDRDASGTGVLDAGPAVVIEGEQPASPLASAAAMTTVPPAGNPAPPVPEAPTPQAPAPKTATAPVGPAAPDVLADLSAPPSAALAFAAVAATVADSGGTVPLTAPAVPASPAPVGPHHHLVPQLSRPLFTLSAAPHGQHTMTLNVTPDALGPLTVRAHIDAAGVRIELFAPADAGREAVRSILHELRRDLDDSGFGASLELSDRSGPSDSGAGGRHGGAGSFGRPAADPIDPPPPAAAPREAVLPRGTVTTLDILA